MTDARRFAPATARNRAPIRDVLADLLPGRGQVLEVASGTGEHVVDWARHWAALSFLPSDPDPDSRASIEAWRRHEGLTNVAEPLALDVTQPDWASDVPPVEAVLCVNMVHIAPWRATEGLLTGAAAILAPGAFLYLYGPYRRGGRHTAESNAAFDESLRERDSEWGVRDLEALEAAARDKGLAMEAVVEMPANNLSVVLRR